MSIVENSFNLKKMARAGGKKKYPKKVGATGIKKNVRLMYSKNDVVLALEEIKRGVSIAAVSRKYKIPESTLRAKKSNKYADKKPGPAAVLSMEEENDLINWIFQCSEAGFPITKPQLLESVQAICQNLKKNNPFTDNKPGRSWYKSFSKRHPEISARISENFCLNRARVSEESLRKWHSKTSDYLISKNILSIDPRRIFDGGETGVLLNPKSLTNCKNAHNTVRNNERENISVLVTGNAAGELAPSFILFSGKSLPKNAAQMAPKEFSLGCSENGLITSKHFYEYIVNVFEPWLSSQEIKRPVIYYLDGHSSHLTFHLSKFCSEHGIVLVALHPNASHIVQPLNVSFFRTFKTEWQKMYKMICSNFSSIGLKKYQFAPILKKTIDALDSEMLLINGFRKCGLCPFDVNAIDFTKVFKRIQDPLYCEVSINESGTMHNLLDPLQVVESLLSENKLQAFRSNETIVWKGLTEDTSLFEIWYKLSHPDEYTSANDFDYVEVGMLNETSEVDQKVPTKTEMDLECQQDPQKMTEKV